ncbi:PPPI inhib domain containing protein [Asbolus verrucosus]|uniref:PPPI inhib domain containing protein n=1 Tax=Asbolus verrucosus TaxID=1661398 RepID=A0A482W5P8_ASBVE|nr:PPPI inhib domain containing protein [Asbolus verrucosus]
MAKDNIIPPFSNGYWIWDEYTNSLDFLSRDVKELIQGSTPAGPQPVKKDGLGTIRFKDTIDNLGQAQFRRQFQRRIKPNEPQIVTIQDVKDVAIFTAERHDLTPEFIEFMHMRKMDEFLRALIVYFQFYFQVWDNLLLRREEAKRKLRQPIVMVLENVVRDNLADLRSMVARNYGYILMGLEETFKHYHMSGATSLSDKDRHLYECLLSMAAKIVWIALLRKNFLLIEMELNRLFRTKIFNIMSRIRQTAACCTNAEEDRILLGKAYTPEKKLKHRSPAVQELIFDNHSYKMLAIGHLRVEPVEERIAYLEAAYTAPEEQLFDLKVGVGILGVSKDYFNPILMPKEGMAKRIHIPAWRMPVMTSDG